MVEHVTASRRIRPCAVAREGGLRRGGRRRAPPAGGQPEQTGARGSSPIDAAPRARHRASRRGRHDRERRDAMAPCHRAWLRRRHPALLPAFRERRRQEGSRARGRMDADRRAARCPPIHLSGLGWTASGSRTRTRSWRRLSGAAFGRPSSSARKTGCLHPSSASTRPCARQGSHRAWTSFLALGTTFRLTSGPDFLGSLRRSTCRRGST